MISVETNIAEFNRTFARYAAVYDPNGWFTADILLKKADMIGYAWSRKLATLAPKRGSIRAERLAALRTGEGIKIRESVRRRLAARLNLRSRIADRRTVFGKRGRGSRKYRGKRMNFQAMAARAEISLRERGIGYSRQVSRFRALGQFAKLRETRNATVENRGRYSQLLATANIKAENLRLVYGGSGTQAGDALTTPEAMSALADAIAHVTQDMEVYLARKAEEAAKEAGFK